MREYKFHSALSPEEIAARLRKRTRPWSRLDAGSARNTFFLKEKRDGELRLIRTGQIRHSVLADLTLARTPEGTEITAAVRATRSCLDIVLAIVLVVGLAVIGFMLTLDIRTALRFLLEYGGFLVMIIGINIWSARIDSKQLPELVTFIEDNLLNE